MTGSSPYSPEPDDANTGSYPHLSQPEGTMTGSSPYSPEPESDDAKMGSSLHTSQPDDMSLHIVLLRALVHSGRVLGYLPLLLWSLVRWPRRTACGIMTYCGVRQSQAWQGGIRRLLELGSSKRPRLLRAQTRPYDPSRQYLLAAHPHGILNYGWWNLICRHGLHLVDGLELCMCVAPAVRFYPLYAELFGDRITDPSKRTVMRILKETTMTPALIPGGFSEAAYTNAHPTVEYAYIADRIGFVRSAIEAGVDIIPAYTYGLNDMYDTPSLWRHWRAVKAQALGIPLLYWFGPFGPISNVPYTEDVTVVTFDPFPASQYSIEQAPQAHADYMLYLERCFESKKAEAGAAHKTLEFISKGVPPAAARSRL